MAEKSLFGTTGIRGPADTLFTNQFSFDIGRTFSRFLDRHHLSGGIAVGMDPRDSSPRIKKALELGLLREGRKIFDEGITSIPSMNYILKVDDSLAGSIMVTGSHIEASLNGLKFFTLKEEISKEHEKEIEEIYPLIKNVVSFNDLAPLATNEARAKEEYIKCLLTLSAKYPSWRVVVDAGNGAQSETMPTVLQKIGCTVIKLHCDLSSKFLARDTEVESAFVELQSKVKTEGADFGVGYDSDGDRVVFVDEKGTFVPGDYTGALVAKNSDSAVIVTPINTSQVIDHIGKKIIRTRVGSAFVIEKMKKFGASFGFEANGGGIFLDMLSRDGGRMTMEVLNILAKGGESFSKLIAELPKFYIEKAKVKYKWELKDTIISEAKAKFKGVKVEEMDGLKIWLNKETWILFRSSANAPEFRVFAESNSLDKAKKLLEKGLGLVREIIAEGK